MPWRVEVSPPKGRPKSRGRSGSAWPWRPAYSCCLPLALQRTSSLCAMGVCHGGAVAPHAPSNACGDGFAPRPVAPARRDYGDRAQPGRTCRVPCPGLPTLAPQSFAHALVEFLVGAAPVHAPQGLPVLIVELVAGTRRRAFRVLAHLLAEFRVVHEAVCQLLHRFLITHLLAHLLPPLFISW